MVSRVLFGISERVALVTGAGGRVGRAIAIELAKSGAHLGVHYSHSRKGAEETMDRIHQIGGRAVTLQADLADNQAAEDIWESMTSSLGGPSILVNSASGFDLSTIGNLGEDSWAQALRPGLEAPVKLMSLLGRDLIDDGAIVNVTDVRVDHPYPERFGYSVAKGALETATKAAALALAPRIRVNAVAPGVINDPPGSDEGFATRIASQLPLKRVGGEESIAHAVRFLIENRFVTGVILPVDGGYRLMNPLSREGG